MLDHLTFSHLSHEPVVAIKSLIRAYRAKPSEGLSGRGAMHQSLETLARSQGNRARAEERESREI